MRLDDVERARWLDPAENEFCEHGLSAASLNRILKTAGESNGRSYNYFEDKAALFRVKGSPLEIAVNAKGAESFWREV